MQCNNGYKLTEGTATCLTRQRTSGTLPRCEGMLIVAVVEVNSYTVVIVRSNVDLEGNNEDKLETVDKGFNIA